MATKRQEMAVQEMVVNGGSVRAAMRKAGYSENTLHTPSKLTNSAGFYELCDQYGLTDDKIIKALSEDITSKVGNRKPELELAAKIKGMLVDRRIDQRIQLNVDYKELGDDELDNYLNG